MKINQIRPQEAKFTEVLSSIALKPKMLYYYGKIDKMGARPPAVAIVGARKYTAYGEEVAYRMGYELAKHGVAVISGLALGIDSIAHRGALDAGGVTMAVLGTPIDRIYPAKHVGLAREIVESGGVVMSEYGPGERARSGQEARARFLMRNRLISALSDAVLVVEANERSGSLNTAAHALEQGRDLWVVPGDINRPTSRGCNRLIFSGANPCLEPADILRALGVEAQQKLKVAGDTPEEEAVIKLLGEGVRDGEQMTERLKLTVEKFNQVVTMLEIKGVVRSLGANQWTLV